MEYVHIKNAHNDYVHIMRAISERARLNLRSFKRAFVLRLYCAYGDHTSTHYTATPLVFTNKV